MNNMNEQNMKNEGFLSMDTAGIMYEEKNIKSFEKGKIYNADGEIICQGIMTTNVNLDSEEMQPFLPSVIQQSPIIHGEKVRFYWITQDETLTASILNMSTDDEIYPKKYEIIPDSILSQINPELMDKTKVYYAIIESMQPSPEAPEMAEILSSKKKHHHHHHLKNYNTTQYKEAAATHTDTTKNNTKKEDVKVILTYIADLENPELIADRRLIKEDKSFVYHQRFNPLQPNHAISAYSTHLYGTLFLCNNGEIIEQRSHLYNVMQSMHKPSTMDFSEFFQLALNPYAKGLTNEEYLEELYCDIKLFVKYFPEYEMELKVLMSKKHH